MKIPFTAKVSKVVTKATAIGRIKDFRMDKVVSNNL